MRQEMELFRTTLNCNYTELYQSYGNSGHINDPSNKYQNINYDGYGNPNSQNLKEIINNGAAFLLYAGHASEIEFSTTRFDVSDVNLLTNKGKYFLGCVVGCSIGSHDERFMTLSEQFQCVKEKGSIAMFVSSILQNWQPPMHMQRQINSTILNTQKTLTIGEIFQSGVSISQFRDFDDYWFFQILGDPCTRFVLTVPEIKSKF
tara:strand:+ start:39 stop:650 length:612 start_codon:yes stop_codon:yes gene_type:complete